MKASRAGEPQAVLSWLTVAVRKAVPQIPIPSPLLPCAPLTCCVLQLGRGYENTGDPAQTDSVWGCMGWQCPGKGWFWGLDDKTVCARPTDGGLHPLSLEPDGIWHLPTAPKPTEHRPGDMKQGCLCLHGLWGVSCMDGVPWAWQREPGVALPAAHPTSCHVPWGLETAGAHVLLHAWMCVHTCVHG